jgi:hypothetical protein
MNQLAETLNGLYKDVRRNGILVLSEGESITAVRNAIKNEDVALRFKVITDLIADLDFKGALDTFLALGTGNQTVDVFLRTLINYLLTFDGWKLNFFTKIVMKLYDIFVVGNLLKKLIKA